MQYLQTVKFNELENVRAGLYLRNTSNGSEAIVSFVNELTGDVYLIGNEIKIINKSATDWVAIKKP